MPFGTFGLAAPYETGRDARFEEAQAGISHPSDGAPVRAVEPAVLHPRAAGEGAGPPMATSATRRDSLQSRRAGPDKQARRAYPHGRWSGPWQARQRCTAGGAAAKDGLGGTLGIPR